IDDHIIDCIDIYQQPAFQHPLLINHTLQLKPNYPSKANDYASKAPLPWNSSKSCPNGTIPIERTQGNSHFTSNHLINHTYKHPQYFLRQRVMQQGNIEDVHEHSLIQVEHDKTYGIKATLNVWNPKLEKQYEFSVSQVWFIGGDRENNLEAGWAVSIIYVYSKLSYLTHFNSHNHIRNESHVILSFYVIALMSSLISCIFLMIIISLVL
ncbi:hypothetical protein Taro_002313, partial [Colocasia esculenta]|nr:hypothetical protein [Colocasia esculenta]